MGKLQAGTWCWSGGRWLMNDAASQDLLKKGIAAAKAARQKPAPPEQIDRHRRQARSRLAQVLKADKNSVQAWLWLSTVVDTPRGQQACLKNVLALDPGVFAQRR